MELAKRFNLSRAFPIHLTVALCQLWWQENINQYAYEKETRHLVAIPYNIPPLVDLRAKANLLPVRVKQVIAALSCIVVFILFFLGLRLLATKGLLENWISYLMLGVLFSSFALLIGKLTYLLFSVRDMIVSDQFNLFIPSAASGYYTYSAAQKMIVYKNRVFWNDLEEISIVDQSKKGHPCFSLKVTGKSGSKIELPIKNIPKTSIDLLAREIEKYAPFCRNLSQLAELSRFQDYEKGLLPFLNYNQLWESLTTRRIAATSFMSLQPNHKLQAGRLTIIRQIASGGFSAVYLAEEADGTKFILKEFVLPFGVEEELAKKASEHFAREAQILQSLNHEQIAKVYDHFVEEERNYLLIEYIAGRTLRQLVFEDGPQSAAKVLSYAIQMVEILNYLHNQDVPIIHRDLTPDNFILSDYGKIFLIDFGSANEFVGTATGTLVGKHNYMSPEQIRGKATPMSDIYSLGQTIYYCLSANEPQPLMSSNLATNETPIMKNFGKLILDCTELEAEKRPQLSAIRKFLLDYNDLYGTGI